MKCEPIVRSHSHLYQQRLGEVTWGLYCCGAAPLAKVPMAAKLDFIAAQGVINLRQKAVSVSVGGRTVRLTADTGFVLTDIVSARALLAAPVDAAVCLPQFTVRRELAAGEAVDLLEGVGFAKASYFIVSDRKADDDPRVSALGAYLRTAWR